MAIDSTVARRFAELESQMNGLPKQRSDVGTSYETSMWQQWATSALHIIRASFGENSPHYQHFASEYAKCHGWDYEVDALKGIFRAAKADYDGGYAFSLQVQISGEIYGDFVVLARAALAEGAKDVAAVLACAALEDSLKRFAGMNGLDVSDKVMQDVVNALKSKGLVGGAQKTLLDAMPKIRDYAMHANWEKITAQDVGSVLGFVEQFLLAKFS
jgi:hypothetical protein